MKKEELCKYLILLIVILSLKIDVVYALTKPNYITDVKNSDADLLVEGVNNVNQNEEFSLNIVLNDIKGSSLMGIQGELEILDDNCISLIVLENMNNVVTYNNKFVYSDFDGFDSNTSLVKAKFKTGQKVCNTTISVNNIKMAFVDGTKIKYEDSASIVINVIEDSNIEVISKENEQKEIEEIIELVETQPILKMEKVNKIELPEVKKINYLKIFARRMISYKDNFKNFINIYFN